MKHKKTILKFLGLLMLGGIFGFAISFLMLEFDYSFLKEIATSTQDFMVTHALWFQVVLGLVLLGPACFLAKKGIELMKSKAYAEDEGELEDLADKKLNLAILLGQLYFIFSIVLFAIITNENNDYVLISASIFLVGIGVYTFIQVWVVNVVKSMDSLKEGDPSSFKFQRQWLSSLDEAEKYKVYEAGFKTFSLTNNLMLFALMGSFFSIIFFDTGMANIFLIALIWAIQTIAFNKYAAKK